MDCRKCKNYRHKKCCLEHHVTFRDGTLDAIEYNVMGKILKDGKYVDCIKDFVEQKEITIFDFIEGE